MKFNINFHIFLRAGRYQTRHAIFTRSSTHLRFILVFDFRFHIPRVKIRWYRRSVFLYERRKRGGGETCLFPIREITTGSGNNPPGWYGLTSILTRVKARPWHHANTATHTHTHHTLTFTLSFFIYASRDINRAPGDPGQTISFHGNHPPFKREAKFFGSENSYFPGFLRF